LYVHTVTLHFIHINTSKQVVAGDRSVMPMPKILQEEKFCDKMIRQGLARKDLQKLDIMARLTAKITLACDSLLRTLPPQVTMYNCSVSMKV
jgi:hypothetical protein